MKQLELNKIYNVKQLGPNKVYKVKQSELNNIYKVKQPGLNKNYVKPPGTEQIKIYYSSVVPSQPSYTQIKNVPLWPSHVKKPVLTRSLRSYISHQRTA